MVKCRIMGSILVRVPDNVDTSNTDTSECHGSMKVHVSTNIYSSEAHEVI